MEQTLEQRVAQMEKKIAELEQERTAMSYELGPVTFKEFVRKAPDLIKMVAKTS